MAGVSVDKMRQVVMNCHKDKAWQYKIKHLPKEEIVILYQRLMGAKRF